MLRRLFSWWLSKCKIFIVGCILVLILGIAFGSIFWPLFGELIKGVAKRFIGLRPFTLEMFIYILINNISILCVWIFIIGGLTVLLPYMILLINAVTLGSFVSYMHVTYGIDMLVMLLLLIPHGIFEITAIIMGVSCSAFFGINVWKMVLKKKPLSELKIDFINVIKMIAFASILMVLAALVETYITPLFYFLFSSRF